MNQLHNPWDQVWSWFLLSLQERFEPWDSLLQTCSSIDSSVIKTGLWRPRKEKGEKKRETRRTFWEKNGHNNCKDERTVQFERSLLLCPSSIESEGRNDDLEGRRLKVQFCKHLRGCFFQDQVYTLHGLLSLSLFKKKKRSSKFLGFSFPVPLSLSQYSFFIFSSLSYSSLSAGKTRRQQNERGFFNCSLLKEESQKWKSLKEGMQSFSSLEERIAMMIKMLATPLINTREEETMGRKKRRAQEFEKQSN